jgi:hypothetical protein
MRLHPPDSLRAAPNDGGGGCYTRASEVGTYVFCRRAWWLERQGAPSSRGPERTAGTAHHVRHGERVAAGERAGGVARVLLIAAAVLLLLGLLGALR